MFEIRERQMPDVFFLLFKNPVWIPIPGVLLELSHVRKMKYYALRWQGQLFFRHGSHLFDVFWCWMFFLATRFFWCHWNAVGVESPYTRNFKGPKGESAGWWVSKHGQTKDGFLHWPHFVLTWKNSNPKRFFSRYSRRFWILTKGATCRYIWRPCSISDAGCLILSVFFTLIVFWELHFLSLEHTRPDKIRNKLQWSVPAPSRFFSTAFTTQIRLSRWIFKNLTGLRRSNYLMADVRDDHGDLWE